MIFIFLNMLNSIVVALLVINIAVDVMLYQRVSYLADNVATINGAASTVKTVVAGGIIDRAILVKDAAIKAKDAVKSLFSRKKVDTK